MRALVAAFGVWGVVALAACFNPQFDNPTCGPAGECPANHTCVQGVCRAMGEEIDAAGGGDGDVTDGAPNDGIDAPNADASFQCVPTTCAGVTRMCGDCIDNDGDGLIDDRDPTCLGPCDNDEGRLTLEVPQEAAGCQQDCFFDSNSGQGDDGCRWDVECYNGSGGNACPFNPGIVGSFQCPNSQNGMCINNCLPLTPNGCDCFGCCLLPNAPQPVLISSRPGGQGMASCELFLVTDPNQCMPCDLQMSCFNNCDASTCELCVGQTQQDLPPQCGGVQSCPAGRNRCGFPGQPACPGGEACITGCCYPSP
jgi:hypothetical protein